MKDDNKSVCLTLKGWLAYRAIECKTLDDFQKLWDDLGKEVERVSSFGGEGGIPALVLNNKGDAIMVIEKINGGIDKNADL